MISRISVAARLVRLLPFAGPLVLFGLLILAGGLWVVRDRLQHRAQAVTVEGIVTDVRIRYTLDEPSWYPIVSFRSPDGRVRTYDSAIASDPPRYRKGDRVTILWDDSTERAMLDTPADLLGPANLAWKLGFFFVVAGLAPFLVVTIASFVSRR